MARAICSFTSFGVVRAVAGQPCLRVAKRAFTCNCRKQQCTVFVVQCHRRIDLNKIWDETQACYVRAMLLHKCCRVSLQSACVCTLAALLHLSRRVAWYPMGLIGGVCGLGANAKEGTTTITCMLRAYRRLVPVECMCALSASKSAMTLYVEVSKAVRGRAGLHRRCHAGFSPRPAGDFDEPAMSALHCARTCGGPWPRESPCFPTACEQAPERGPRAF